MEPKRSNHFLAHLPTILLLVLFAMSPWLGILFFILRAIDRDAEKKEQTNADPARDSHAEDARTAQSAASGQRSETVSDPDVPTAEQKSAKQWHKTLTTLCTIFGAIFLLVGIGDLADVMEELCWDHEIDWGELLTALDQTIGGGQHRAGRVVRGGRHRRSPWPRCGGTRHRPRLFRCRCLH